MTDEETCSLGDGEPRYARGWCSVHYTRWYVHGDPLVTKRIMGDDRARFETKVDRSDGNDACHPWLAAVNRSGYGYFYFDGRMRGAHIVAWALANGPTPVGTELDHECHNRAVLAGTCAPGVCRHRLCCNPSHLAPKTRLKHRADSAPFGHARRINNGRAKLTEQQVSEIKAGLSAGMTMAGLARTYGVGATTVRAIRDGKTWVD